jgi:hypothetical protein
VKETIEVKEIQGEEQHDKDINPTTYKAETTVTTTSKKCIMKRHPHMMLLVAVPLLLQ